MILKRRVSLGGVQLDELHESIVIRAVDTGIPNETVQAVNRMGLSGQRVTGQHWESLDVIVTWAMNVPKTDMALRRQIYETVTAWAMKKGWLRVSYMENRRMYVDKTIPPSSGNLWEWTDEFSIIFRAYNVPFWQEETPMETVVKSIKTGSAVITVNGIVSSPLNVIFENISGQVINNFAVSAGGNTLTFTGVNLAANKSIEISHGNDGLLRAKAGGSSIYGIMTGADDLIVSPGNVTVSVDATRTGKLTLRSYGRYL